jgi:hypothetical protein
MFPPDAVNLLLMAGDCCKNCPQCDQAIRCSGGRKSGGQHVRRLDCIVDSLGHTLTDFAQQAYRINRAGNCRSWSTLITVAAICSTSNDPAKGLIGRPRPDT